MFRYESNHQVKQEIKKILIDKNISAKKVSDTLCIKPQQYNNIFNKKNLSLADLKKITDAIDCELYIEIKRKK